MARWTESRADLLRIASSPQEIPMAGIVSMRLSNGLTIEGVIRRMNFGNNAGLNGWRYYGEYELESIDGTRWVVDVLDIEKAHSVWEGRHADYEAAGRITIIR